MRERTEALALFARFLLRSHRPAGSSSYGVQSETAFFSHCFPIKLEIRSRNGISRSKQDRIGMMRIS